MNAERYRIEYGESALGDLERLPPRERAQILRKIQRLKQGLYGDIKRLQNADVAYRLRMGNYRVLFDLTGGVIIVRRIGDRKDVYD